MTVNVGEKVYNPVDGSIQTITRIEKGIFDHTYYYFNDGDFSHIRSSFLTLRDINDIKDKLEE